MSTKVPYSFYAAPMYVVASRLSPSQKLVMAFICSQHVHFAGNHFETERTIAKSLGISTRSVERSISFLKALQAIQVERMSTGRGYDRNKYCVNLDTLSSVLTADNIKRVKMAKSTKKSDKPSDGSTAILPTEMQNLTATLPDGLRHIVGLPSDRNADSCRQTVGQPADQMSDYIDNTVDDSIDDEVENINILVNFESVEEFDAREWEEASKNLFPSLPAVQGPTNLPEVPEGTLPEVTKTLSTLEQFIKEL
jgi:hypothetical protein